MADKDETKQQDKAAADKPKRTPAKKPAAKKPAAKKSESAEAKSAPAKSETKTPRKRTATKKPAATKGKAETKDAEAKAKPDAEAKKDAASKPATRRRAPRAGVTSSRRRAPAAHKGDGKAAPARPVVRAKAKYVRSSARKARLVMEHVRGKSVGDARALLQHSPRGVARDVQRLLESAIANAENNHDLVGDDLYVKEIYADEGPTLKRYRPRAQGRVYRVRKRTSHLSVALSTRE